MRRTIAFLLFFAGCLSSSGLYAQTSANTLTATEKAEGWHLLFDGRSLQSWHSYLEAKPGRAWQVQNGMIFLNKDKHDQYKDYADLVTNEEYENFDLKLEWKMEPCSNSGVMFYVHESPEYKETYETGPEMQIADLACNDDGRILKCRAGDLYDLIPADTEWVNAGGHWNHYEIRSDHGHLQFFLNGHKTIDTYLWDDHWRDLIAHSKFAVMPNFGTFRKGHISLQGTETGKLWFRNIKIKQL